ncbi:MAG: glycine--tRNA ligase subunit alpha [Planctomycetota bacterium]
MYTFTEVVEKLNEYWRKRGAYIWYPYDIEKGAATFNPITFFSCLDNKDHFYAFIEPCRRPADGRYAKNPNRLQHYFQYQVIIKPAPKDSVALYVKSLEYLGLDLKNNEIRFVEDDWESPTLGASGLGWEVWCNFLEITQFTYFQKMASIELKKYTLEITYGLERICMITQKKNNVFDILWDKKDSSFLTYQDIKLTFEHQFNQYNYQKEDVNELRNYFTLYENTCQKLLSQSLYYPAYDYALKCSHIFNLLDAKRAFSFEERNEYIHKIRKLAKQCAQIFLDTLNGSKGN